MDQKTGNIEKSIGDLLNIVIPFMERSEPGKCIFLPVSDDVSFRFERKDTSVVMLLAWGSQTFEGERPIIPVWPAVGQQEAPGAAETEGMDKYVPTSI